MSSNLGRVSQNLSLRFSPERKYPPTKTVLCPPKYICCPRSIYCCRCHCCHCCCCVPCCNPCLNFDYSSSSFKTKNEKGNNLANSQNFMESTKNQTKEPQVEEEPKENINQYVNYEQNQFNDFLRKLMDVESKIEDAKISLAINPDFNCEDAFRLFETNDKGFLDKDDIKEGLNLLCIFPTGKELNLLMKRFDLQKNGYWRKFDKRKSI